jgi:DNA-binding response OmpR family regulator
LLRRAGGRANPVLELNGLRLDPAAHSVSLDGRPVNLSGREFALLHLLLDHAGRVLTRVQLEQALYGWEGDVESNSLEVHIHHLRKKLGSERIRTLRGVGYSIPR